MKIVDDVLNGVGQYASIHLHDAGVALSAALDVVSVVVITSLLILRLFQWKKAGSAVIPVMGLYLLLKVVLPS